MRMVLLTIADAANRDGEHAHPGVRAMCEGSLYSEPSVRRTLSRLVTDGWLEVTAHGKGGRGLATEYRVIMEPETLSPRQGFEDGNPIKRKQKPYQTEAETLSTPTTAPITQHKDQRKTNVGTSITLSDDHGFEDFWTAYPRRNGKRLGRRVTLSRWATLNLEDRRAAWRGAIHYGHACDSGLTIAKDPVRWVRDRCWEDWQSEATANNPTGQKHLDPLRGRHTESLDDLMRGVMST